MAVKIVTDSSADLPAPLVAELGIEVVPLYVRFGEKVYRDRIDITEDEFYQKLQRDPVHPSTIQPTPQDFTEVYQRLAQEADGIVSIHISSKLSGTHSSALQGRANVATKCPIEVIDSQATTMGLGLIDVLAARAAKEGKGLAEVVAEAEQAIPDIHFLALFDTLKYLLLGGRIGKAKALLGAILNVKPMLTLKEGEVTPAGQVRTRGKGIQRLIEFVKNATNIQELAVIYNTTPDEARDLAESIGSIFPKEKMIVSRIGPLLGVHMGPGALVVTFRGRLPGSSLSR